MDNEIAEDVKRVGWSGLNVFDNNPPFYYTVGLMQSFSHPELIVFGLNGDNAGGMVSYLVQKIREGQSYAEPGVREFDVNGNKISLGFRPVHDSQHELYLGFAMGFMRRIDRWDDLEAVQVFWADKDGKFPFDVGCDYRAFESQPRLDLGLTPKEIKKFRREGRRVKRVSPPSSASRVA